MSLKPFDLSTRAADLPDELNEILIGAGLSKDTKPDSDKKLNLSNARKVFNMAGADLDHVAQAVSDIMGRGETDAGRLKAAELALKVHGILQDIDEKQIPQIIINVGGSGNKTLINLVLPTN